MSHQADFTDLVTDQTVIDPAVLNAYFTAHFKVFGNIPFTLKVGEHSRTLRRLFTAGSPSAAYITAFNPRGEPLNESVNLDRHDSLVQYLKDEGLIFLEGEGIDVTGDWKGEPSVLILGIKREDAIQLGRECDQNAIVWIDSDAIPRLLLLR